MMNHADNLLSIDVSSLIKEEKLLIKRLGPHQPKDFVLCVKDGKQNRKFKPEWYDRFPWLTVSTVKKGLLCFNCLLFGDGYSDSELTWTNVGFTHLKNFHERASKHQKSNLHLHATARLKTLGSVDTAAPIDSGYRLSILRHNERVTMNRKVLEKVIECVRFCGENELPLRGHDERQTSSNNKGVFLNLIDLLAESEQSLKDHLQAATVGRYTSAQIQNEILDCIYSAYIDDLYSSIKEARFVSIEADETTDASCRSQFVLIFRFIENNIPVERFLKFVNVHDRSANGLSDVIQEELLPLKLQDKLIAQTYDGAAVMSGASGGVQTLIKHHYPHAHFVHCYSHQTNLVLKKASSVISDARLFFSNISGFSTFFGSSPKRADTLKKVTDQSLPHTCETRWNFQSRVVQSVHDNRNELVECLNNITTSTDWDDNTTREAIVLSSLLEDDQFQYFLDFFNKIFDHTDVLFKQFQSSASSGLDVSNSVQDFTTSIQEIRAQLSETLLACGKRKRVVDPSIPAKEVCDVLLNQMEDRFGKSSFIQSFVVLNPAFFNAYKDNFPINHIENLMRHYPFLSKENLTTELQVIYSNEAFNCENISGLFKIINDFDLASTFEQVTQLLQIILTTPISSPEAEPCFSTLKRIKTFLRNSMGQDILNALAVLSIHSELIDKDRNFNIKVIEKFSSLRERRLHFHYK